MPVHGMPLLLADVLVAHAKARPEATALRFDGIDCSYALLAAECERASARLWHGWGVRPGDRVAWLGANHPGQVALLFALARIGAVLLPLNFRLAFAEWQRLIGECSPRHLVHDADWAQAARDLAAQSGLAAHAVESLVHG